MHPLVCGGSKARPSTNVKPSSPVRVRRRLRTKTKPYNNTQPSPDCEVGLRTSTMRLGGPQANFALLSERRTHARYSNSESSMQVQGDRDAPLRRTPLQVVCPMPPAVAVPPPTRVDTVLR